MQTVEAMATVSRSWATHERVLRASRLSKGNIKKVVLDTRLEKPHSYTTRCHRLGYPPNTATAIKSIRCYRRSLFVLAPLASISTMAAASDYQTVSATFFSLLRPLRDFYPLFPTTISISRFSSVFNTPHGSRPLHVFLPSGTRQGND